MRLRQPLLLLVLGATLGFGQMTMDQKIADFQYMAGVYAKRYGPYEWKRDTIGFDLLNLAPWLDKVRATKNDLDFYEVAVQYVSSLNDAHDAFTLPSSFVARLNFSVDIFDDKLLVEAISRTRLPASEFQFLVGYELVSIDGQDANKLLDGLLKYDIAANPRSTRRAAAALLTTRPQQVIPTATETPDISTVVFRRPDDKLETYRIPWTKSGLPLTSVGKYATPGAVRRTLSEAGDGITDIPTRSSALGRFQNLRVRDREVLNFGSVTPVFAPSLPFGFVQRLGRSSADFFYSGTFDVAGLKIGFIRIPTFAPLDPDAATLSFAREIAYFQANTDGLVIDEMRNGGGSGLYTGNLLSLVMPTKWQSIGFKVRSTSEWVIAISDELETAKVDGTDQATIDQLQIIKDEIVAANHAQRGMTNPIPLDDVTIDREPLRDARGALIAYTKPLIVLIDEFSASASEVFAATIQDNARGPLLGYRTMGAGGNVEDWWSGSYSMGVVSVTESLMNRKAPVITPDYPTAPYVENIGVRPDILIDYMTKDNLMRNGKDFVDHVVTAIVNHIQSKR